MRTDRSRSSAAAALVAAAGLAIAGCGYSHARPLEFAQLSGPEITSQAIADTAAAKTVHIRTTADSPTVHLVFDLTRTADGTCYGRLSLAGRDISVILTDRYAFVRGDAQYWHWFERQLRVPGFGERMAKNSSTWARVQTGGQYRMYCDVEKLAEFSGLSSNRTDEMHPGEPYDGKDGSKLLDVSDTSGQPTITVDASTPHHLREIHFLGSHSVLDGFDEPASVEIPVEGDYIALDNFTVAL